MLICRLNHQIQKNLGVNLFCIASMVCTLSKKTRAHFINIVATNFELDIFLLLLLMADQTIKATIVTTSRMFQRDIVNGWITI